jgi:hypothetical protein
MSVTMPPINRPNRGTSAPAQSEHVAVDTSVSIDSKNLRMGLEPRGKPQSGQPIITVPDAPFPKAKPGALEIAASLVGYAGTTIFAAGDFLSKSFSDIAQSMPNTLELVIPTLISTGLLLVGVFRYKRASKKQQNTQPSA